jgi:hypothetical protein
MAIENWCDAPEIHPSEIRVGDIIGTANPSDLRYAVKLISAPLSAPQKSSGRWTFFGRDAKGHQRTNTFGDGQLVRRFDKAS